MVHDVDRLFRVRGVRNRQNGGTVPSGHVRTCPLTRCLVNQSKRAHPRQSIITLLATSIIGSAHDSESCLSWFESTVASLLTIGVAGNTPDFESGIAGSSPAWSAYTLVA